MRNIWFLSDTHFDHANIIRFSRRPQFQEGDVKINDQGKEVWVSQDIAERRVRDMNEMLVSNFNELVNPGDEVWHLGDFCMAKRDTQERTEYFARRLNGQLNWVFGNHDHSAARKAEGFQSKSYFHTLRSVGINKAPIILCHYAMRVWDRRQYGAIQLYGHSHGNLPEASNALSFDVGVDCHDYKPIHLDDVLSYCIKKRDKLDSKGINWKGEDHHGVSGR